MNEELEQIIAGAVYDLAGYLTTLEQPFLIGTMNEAPALFEQVVAWAFNRGLSLDKPFLNNWKEKANELCPIGQQDTERSGPAGRGHVTVSLDATHE
jgi:hypothetical protein